jgi:hypothetical protein
MYSRHLQEGVTMPLEFAVALDPLLEVATAAV